MDKRRLEDANIRQCRKPETALDLRLVARPYLAEEAICQIRIRTK